MKKLLEILFIGITTCTLVVLVGSYGSMLKTQFIDIDMLWGDFFNEKPSLWRVFDDFEMAEGTKNDFKNLHTEWQKDFEFLIAKFDEQEGVYIPGLTYESGINYDEYEQALRESLKILQDTNNELDGFLKATMEACVRQKSSVKCP